LIINALFTRASPWTSSLEDSGRARSSVGFGVCWAGVFSPDFFFFQGGPAFSDPLMGSLFASSALVREGQLSRSWAPFSPHGERSLSFSPKLSFGSLAPGRRRGGVVLGRRLLLGQCPSLAAGPPAVSPLPRALHFPGLLQPTRRRAELLLSLF